MKQYEAHEVLVFTYDDILDPSLEYIVPFECDTLFDKEVPVIFDNDYDTPVGKVKLSRKDYKIFGDFILSSTMQPSGRAFDLIRSLIPSICFQVLKRDSESILAMRITSVSLGYHANMDPMIKPLGDKVYEVMKPGDYLS